ncbi:hypothetical protein ACF07Z_17510 [Streptomyces albidoflavus]
MLLVTGVALVATLTAGCGDDDPSRPPEGKSPDPKASENQTPDPESRIETVGDFERLLLSKETAPSLGADGGDASAATGSSAESECRDWTSVTNVCDGLRLYGQRGFEDLTVTVMAFGDRQGAQNAMSRLFAYEDNNAEQRLRDDLSPVGNDSALFVKEDSDGSRGPGRAYARIGTVFISVSAGAATAPEDLREVSAVQTERFAQHFAGEKPTARLN